MTARPGMLLGIGRFYHDPRGSVRAVRSTQPRESTMLAWLMIGLAIVLLGQLVALSAQVPVGSEAFLPRAGAAVFSLIFLAPLVWYALAAMATLVARAFRGDGSWRDGRLAVFWANLVAAPVQAISIVGAELAEGMGAIASTVVSAYRPAFLCMGSGPVYRRGVSV